MAGTHTEAILNKLSKPKHVQLLLNTEANTGAHVAKLTAEIKEINNHLNKLEADVAATKNVNSQLVDQLVKTERQCWANAQYSRRECLEVVGIATSGIPTSVKDDALEDKVLNVFRETGVEIGQRDIQACHSVKNNRTIVKFSHRKDFPQILMVKKQLKNLDYALFNFPDGTNIFVNESLCSYYKGLRNKCKAVKNKNKLDQFYTINGIVRVKLVEHGPATTVTHISDLEELFPDINIGDL